MRAITLIDEIAELTEERDAWIARHEETLEGSHYVIKGGYVIKGVKGEFYPCTPDIFELTYEAVL